MESRLCIIWLLTFFVCYSTDVFADTSFYTAGVVEFRPTIRFMSSSELLADHLQSYLDIIESAEANDTDIIVFPEGTLNNENHLTFVPDSKDGIIPCLTTETKMYADFFVELSCAARRLHKYLVINLTEKENCSSVQLDPRPCASDDLNIYNTNVVFDREGRVVSRYRKVHVYVENKNTTYEPEYAIFDTDFGVRFGHFICFDVLFYTPAQELVDRFGITDFIFTSLFFSELPFLTAVQLQHGWAWGNNVNLLAAGASYPKSGITGSGIYAGRQGDLISVMVSGAGERKLYKARVPKNVQGQQQTGIAHRKSNHFKSNIYLLKDPQITHYTSVLLDLSQPTNFSQQLCQEDLCCTFDIVTNTVDQANYKYRIGVFNGRRTYEKKEWSYIKVCALYGCANDDASSCGELPIAESTESALKFKNISISGRFTKSKRVMIMPTTIDDELYPLNKDVVYWQKSEKRNIYEVNFCLTQDQSNILTFGIYAHYYDKSLAISNVRNYNLKYPLLFFILLQAIFL